MPANPLRVPLGKSRAFWIEGGGRGEIRTENLSAPGPGEALVRTLHSAVSRGTETLVFRGEVPESEYGRMRAPYQSGDFPAPVKYGYANVGVVEQGPPALQGRNVFCLYPHQTHYVLPVDALHLVPDHVPPARAVLAANMETAVNVLWDAAPRVGDRIAVVGAGVVGLLVGWLAARIPGCDVQMIDTQPERTVVAEKLGVAFAMPDAARGDADLVVHASGHPQGLVTALGLAAFEARVVEASWYGDKAVSLPLGAAFHARRLRLISSQVGHIAAAQRSRWDYRRRMTLALSLLVADELDALMTDSAPFDQLPEVLARLSVAPSLTLCQRIDYP